MVSQMQLQKYDKKKKKILWVFNEIQTFTSLFVSWQQDIIFQS